MKEINEEENENSMAKAKIICINGGYRIVIS
jgi:hypothetical protein